MTGPVERVALTHLQIPLKERMRVSVGEAAVRVPRYDVANSSASDRKDGAGIVSG